MNELYIIQDDLDQTRIIQTQKTVEWLTCNTKVKYFNPIDFTGYQRKINEEHCKGICEYIKTKFYMPSAVVCATQKEYNENEMLYIVDGQHRVEAFKILKKEDPERYEMIKNYCLPVIVLEKATEMVEIDTFITINKTSKKVDTSLAYVLRNKLNNNKQSDDLTMPKRAYISVQLAWTIDHPEEEITSYDSTNSNEKSLWYGRISYEAPFIGSQTISLNSFVKATKVLANYLEKVEVLNCNWKEQREIDECVRKLYNITEFVWNTVKKKWPEVFTETTNSIIMGAIGYTAICKFLAAKIKDNKSRIKESNICEMIKLWIDSINVDYNEWLPGRMFSKYTSESGYTYVAGLLYDSCDIIM